MGFSPSLSSHPLESQPASLCTELPEAVEKTTVETDPGPHKKATPWGQEMGPRAPIKGSHRGPTPGSKCDPSPPAGAETP